MQVSRPRLAALKAALLAPLYRMTDGAEQNVPGDGNMEKRTAGKSLLDRTFKYTSSARTDIRKTFRRERARLAALRATEHPGREGSGKVPTLNIIGRTTAGFGRRAKIA